MKQGVLERVLQVYSSISNGDERFDSKFAELIGSNKKTISQQLKGERAISLDTILNILAAFPDISSEWLLRGKGKMTLSDNLPPILGDESDNDLDTHAMLAQARKEIDTLHIKIASLKEKNLKQAGCIEWQKDFISELIAEKTELEKKLPNEVKKDIV